MLDYISTQDLVGIREGIGSDIGADGDSTGVGTRSNDHVDRGGIILRTGNRRFLLDLHIIIFILSAHPYKLKRGLVGGIDCGQI